MKREQSNQGAPIINLARERAKRQTSTGNRELNYRELPTPTPETYALIARAIVKGPEEDMDLLHNTLNDIYKALGDTDPFLIDFLSKKQIDGIISSEDKLYLVVLCMVGKVIGPFEIRNIRDLFFQPNIPSGDIDNILAQISLDETIKKYLKTIITKILT